MKRFFLSIIFCLFLINSISAFGFIDDTLPKLESEDVSTSSTTTIISGNLTNLSQMLDVNGASWDDGDFLEYDSSAEQWVAVAVAPGGTDTWALNFTKYINKTEIGNNFSLYLQNNTVAIQQLLNVTGIYSTYNATYAAGSVDTWSLNFTKYINKTEIGNNFSLYLQNNTVAIQQLLNDTGIYSTHNSSYVPYTSATSNVDLGDWNITSSYFLGNWNGTSPDDWIIMDGSGVEFNESKLSSIYYNGTQSVLVAGTLDGGTLVDTQHPDASYDSISINFSEESGSPGLDLRVNFTGVESFNRGVMRYKTSSLSGDFPIRQLWDYNDGVWENYPAMVENDEGFVIFTQPIFDNADHVQDGIIQMRLYKASNGNTQNHYYLDWIAMVKGYGTPSGEEVDPFFETWLNNPVFNDGVNVNASEVNITADTFFGDWNGSVNYYLKSELDNNFSLYLQNNTLALQQLLNDTGIYSTYNATYASNVDTWSLNFTKYINKTEIGNNFSLYLQNNTLAIQQLLNSTGIYSTYNATYTLYNDTDLALGINTTINLQNLLNGTNSTWDWLFANNVDVVGNITLGEKIKDSGDNVAMFFENSYLVVEG